VLHTSLLQLNVQFGQQFFEDWQVDHVPLLDHCIQKVDAVIVALHNPLVGNTQFVRDGLIVHIRQWHVLHELMRVFIALLREWISICNEMWAMADAGGYLSFFLDFGSVGLVGLTHDFPTEVIAVFNQLSQITFVESFRENAFCVLQEDTLWISRVFASRSPLNFILMFEWHNLSKETWKFEELFNTVQVFELFHVNLVVAVIIVEFRVESE